MVDTTGMEILAADDRGHFTVRWEGKLTLNHFIYLPIDQVLDEHQLLEILAQQRPLPELEQLALDQTTRDAYKAKADKAKALAPPAVAALTVPEWAQAKRRQLREAFARAAQTISADYPEAEVKTWDQQREQARALLAKPSAPAMMVRQMAQARSQATGATLTEIELAQRIVAKADAFEAIISGLLGRRHGLEDRIDAIEAQFKAGTLLEADAHTALEAISW